MNEIVTSSRGPLTISGGKSFGELGIDDQARLAKAIADSGMFPAFNTTQKVMVILMAGQSAGLTMIESTQYLYVVKGRVAWMGDGALAQIRRSGKCNTLSWEWYDDEVNGRTCSLTAQRTDDPQKHEFVFCERDAERMGLWGKKPNWVADPDSMLLWRCVSRMAKMLFPDALMGMGIVEVQRDHDYPDAGDPNSPAEIESADSLFEKLRSIAEPERDEIVAGRVGLPDDDAPAAVEV